MLMFEGANVEDSPSSSSKAENQCLIFKIAKKKILQQSLRLTTDIVN